MGFFDRSKKVKKPNTDIAPPVKPLPLPPRSQQPPSATRPSRQQGPSGFWQTNHPPAVAPPVAIPFQPAGYLPAPPGWIPQNPQGSYGYQRPCPIIVNQHYYLSPAHAAPSAQKGSNPLERLTGSVVNLAKDVMPGSVNTIPQLYDDGLSVWQNYGTQILNSTAALYDQIASRFSDVLTLIDSEKVAGNELELFSYQPALAPPVNPPPVLAPVSNPPPVPTGRAGRSPPERAKPHPKGEKFHPKGQTTAVAATVVSGSYFAKVDLYANSRLPTNLPNLELHFPTWPLICLAAQYSERVYATPKGAERDAHVNADWKTGTKAMVIKSVPMDHMNTIVFAIRGTATFMDWAVNLNTSPTPPTNFLDDTTNLCHGGFLSVARKMLKPVAARLRQLLEEDPGRSCYSLLITGHSAGGAVAALLYSHMLAKSATSESELNILTGCFKRIHCVTFGAPPVSVRPLVKPERPELRKSIFLSFVNEGDPVARADSAYVRSLLELFAAPPPDIKPKAKGTNRNKEASSTALVLADNTKKQKRPKKEKSKASLSSKPSKASVKSSSSKALTGSRRPVWQVPARTLTNAGRLVVLRSGAPRGRGVLRTVEERLNAGVVAHTVENEALHGVVWGDPVAHMMRLYAGRVETLAVGAVTARY